MIHPQITHSRFVFGNLSWYALLIALGILLAVLLASREERHKGLPKDFALDIALLAVPFGILGARLYYVLFQLPYYWRYPLKIFAIWEGGLAIYGAVIGGFFAVLLLCRRRGANLAKALDAIVPGLILAQAIGRWGNFFNMEAYGAPVSDPAWQFFPFAVDIPGTGYHMATFFYEFVWNMLVFFVLWHGRRHIHRDGDTTLQYFGLYACGRSFIEGLRSDSLYLSGIRISQLLSILAVAVVLLLLLLRYVKTGAPKYVLALPLCFLLAVAGLLLGIALLSVLGMLLCAALLLRLYIHPLSIAAAALVLAALTLVLLHHTVLSLLCYMLAGSFSLLALFQGEKT